LRARRVLLPWLVVTMIAVLVTQEAGERMQRGIFDSWQAANPRNLSATDVRVVLIDDRSIEFLGAWQWPRYYLARLTEELARRQAKVIASTLYLPNMIGSGRKFRLALSRTKSGRRCRDQGLSLPISRSARSSAARRWSSRMPGWQGAERPNSVARPVDCRALAPRRKSGGRARCDPELDDVALAMA
jgi:hypothetical protein